MTMLNFRKGLFSLSLGVGLLLAAGGAPVSATTIGPDAFGYSATDEVQHTFTDISGTGTRVFAGSDDVTATAAIPFNFSFYGAGYNSVGFSPNGLLTFGGTTGQFTNQDLGGAMSFGSMPAIAVLWDDWQFFQSGADATYYETIGAPGSQEFIVQWNNAFGFASSPEAVTFQVVLYEATGDIRFNYLDTITGDARDLGAQATVGIRNGDGHLTGEYLQWTHNGFDGTRNTMTPITGGQSIHFSAVPEPATMTLLGAMIPAGYIARRRKLKAVAQ